MRALAVYGGDLVAGGFFTSADSTLARFVARWNGTSWDSMGYGVSGSQWGVSPYVADLATHNGRLYAAGHFKYAGGPSNIVQNVATWDGSSWSPLDGGIGFSPLFGAEVYALAVHQDQLFAGGNFEHASGVYSHYMASWNIPASVAVPDDPLCTVSLIPLRAHPNPFRSRMSFHYTLPHRGTVHLTIHDVQGRMVATVANGVEEAGPHTALWDGRSDVGVRLSAGIYFGRLAWEGQVTGQKVIKLD